MMRSVSSHTSLRPSAARQARTWHAPFSDVIERNDTEALRLHLQNNQNLASAILHDLIDQAFQKRDCSMAIKETLFGHPSIDMQHALHLAVQYDDLPAAKALLRQGGDPNQLTIYYKSNDMRDLLRVTRHKNILYPPGRPPRGAEGWLDEALRNDQYDAAQNMLNQAMMGKSLRETWRDAVKNNCVDVQRAIILLRAAEDRGYRLEQ